MKFLKAEAFEKHLVESLPAHLSPLYILLMNDAFERDFLAKRIVRATGLPCQRVTEEELLEEISSPSLFSEKEVLLCDEIEKSKEKTLPLSEHLILILMGNAEPPFFDFVKKVAVTLDLTKEKPWESKSRLQRWLLEEARAKGKTLSSDAATYLSEGGADFAFLLQELEKAALYAGEDKQISLEYVKAVGSLSPLQTGWQISEALVWGGTLSRRSVNALEDLYSLVGQIRYQLNLGLTLASGKEAPKLSPKRADKLKALAQSLSLSYFISGLKELFTLEMRMRSNITNPILLLDTFHAKLAEKRHVISSS